MISAGKLPQWRLWDWAPLGKKGAAENQCQLGPPLIFMVNGINTLTVPLGEIHEIGISQSI